MDNSHAQEPLFYLEPTCRETEVMVVRIVEDEQFGAGLVFDDTVCHPHGGGQKGDRATLILPPGVAAGAGLPEELVIRDTRRIGPNIVHIPEVPLTEQAMDVLLDWDELVLRLDWDFRSRQMRLHSTAHLLHCFVEQEVDRTLPYPETSDIQPDYGLNRYGEKDLFSEVQAQAAVTKLNQFLQEGHAISTYPDMEKQGFRYWQCEDWIIPCGGTHPQDTKEIGSVEAEYSSRKGRTSLRFTLAGLGAYGQSGDRGS